MIPAAWRLDKVEVWGNNNNNSNNISLLPKRGKSGNIIKYMTTYVTARTNHHHQTVIDNT